jgi:Peptidase M10 serralysin C terminal
MARLTITDAAGRTRTPLHVTDQGTLVSNSDDRLVARAEVILGPFSGEIATVVMLGSFDRPRPHLVELRQSVDGELHFRLTFERPIPLDDFFAGDLGEPITVIGNRFDNLITGDRTGDRLIGNGGADRLNGYGDADDLRGGFGADRFIFLSSADSRAGRHDTIHDFGEGRALIVLKAIDADLDAHGNQAFDFIGGGDFSGTAGELRADRRAAATWLLGDTDGDGAADLAIRLTGEVVPTEDDILL